MVPCAQGGQGHPKAPDFFWVKLMGTKTPQKTRPHIEDAQVFSVSALLRAQRSGRHSLHLDISPPATSWLAQFWLRLGDKTGEVDLTYEVQINGIWEVLDDTIQLEATCPSYGGRRWWFRCPVTGRRAAKLYLFPEQRRFCHRTGIDPAPTYQSQRVSGAHRVYCRLYNLRQRLPDQGSILETLRRPRGMHVKTYFRLLQRDAEIWNSPQNTLVKWFKQSGSSSALDDFPG
jgi:hypothetical protein